MPLDHFVRRAAAMLVAMSVIPAAFGKDGAVEAYLDQSQNTDILEGFRHPPRIARPLAWMWWHNGFVSREGITKDLECYAQNGLGGVATFDRSWASAPDGGVHFMTEEWRACFAHAVREAARLGLEIGFHNCAGHSESGGPWITPEMSMKKLVWARKDVHGGGRIAVDLPKPASHLGYYRDAFLVAFPQVAAIPEFNRELNRITISDGEDPDFATDGCGTSAAKVGSWTGKDIVMDFFLNRKIAAEVLTLDFARWISTKDAVNRFVWTGTSAIDVGIQSVDSSDGNAREVASFTIDKRPVDHPRLSCKFPKTESAHFRLVFRMRGGANLLFPTEIAFLRDGEIPLWNPEISNIEAKLCNAPAQVAEFRPGDAQPHQSIAGDKILVFEKPDEEGRAVLDLPDGEWTLLRFGETTTGMICGPAELSGAGLECDKFSPEAVTWHFNSFAKVILDDNQEYLGRTLSHVEIDSWECKFQNWTSQMPEYFRELRGYDLRKYAPVFAGFMVDSPEGTERFACDFRRTCADLVAANYFGTFRKLCNARGVALMVEGLYNWPETHNASDTLLNWGQVDVPMDEFWYDWSLVRRSRKELVDTIRESASACNAYNRRVLAAEALTSVERDYWRISPFDNKDFGDMALVQGINRFVLHGSTHQPDDRWPGYLGSEGQKFHRNNPWFTMSRGFIDYYARCQFLLQRGFLFADVLYFAGDSVPTDPQPPQGAGLPAGYRSHVINADALVRFASVTDGKITLPNGSRFAVLVLPNRPGMDLASLKKIEELVAGGAVVLGPPPVRALTLRDYPDCDAEVRNLAENMWRDCNGKTKTETGYGKGKIYNGLSLAEVLKRLDIRPDFEYRTDSQKRHVGFAHRRDGDDEIYFVTNYEDREVNISAMFGSPKTHCELWHPEFGELFPLKAERLADGRAKVELKLGRKEAVFVVFRDQPSGGYSPSVNARLGDGIPALEIAGPWKISFAPEKMRAPAPFVADKLFPLEKSADPEVKYFSGYITYETKIVLPEGDPAPDTRYVLSLGDVPLIAEVHLNGKTVAAPFWKPPYACDVTDFLHPGENALKVVTANYLANRLVGDAALPQSQRVTWLAAPDYVKAHYKPDSPLMPSGLLGPVVLKKVRPNSMPQK